MLERGLLEFLLEQLKERWAVPARDSNREHFFKWVSLAEIFKAFYGQNPLLLFWLQERYSLVDYALEQLHQGGHLLLMVTPGAQRLPTVGERRETLSEWMLRVLDEK